MKILIEYAYNLYLPLVDEKEIIYDMLEQNGEHSPINTTRKSVLVFL